MKDTYNLIDPHYKQLSKEQKRFLGITSLGFLLLALMGYAAGFFTVFEAILVFILGVVFMQLVKIEYRLTDLEK